MSSSEPLIRRVKDFVTGLDFSVPDLVISRLSSSTNNATTAKSRPRIKSILLEDTSFLGIPGELMYLVQKKDSEIPGLMFLVSNSVEIFVDPDDIIAEFLDYELRNSKKRKGRWISCRFEKIKIIFCSDELDDKTFLVSAIMLNPL